MIVIGTYDVGPAHYLLALCRHLESPCVWVGSELSKPLFTEQGHDVLLTLPNTRPNLVLTGSGVVGSLDRDLINWAIQQGVPSVSVIDHWSWYRKRFEVGGQLVLPDFIIVNDEIAMDEAIEEGLPKNRLFAGGNPWLEKLSCEVLPVFDECVWRDEFDFPQGAVLVFITEALRDAFPENSCDYLGYDEFSVLRSLIEVVPDGTTVVIKRHPEEPADKYSKLLIPDKVYSIGQVSIAELALGASHIVGMASMLLLELAMYRSDVISFRPDARLPFIGNTIGATVPVNTQDILGKILRNPQQSVSSSIREKFKGSGNRIGNFLNELMQ